MKRFTVAGPVLNDACSAVAVAPAVVACKPQRIFMTHHAPAVVIRKAAANRLAAIGDSDQLASVVILIAHQRLHRPPIDHALNAVQASYARVSRTRCVIEVQPQSAIGGDIGHMPGRIVSAEIVVVAEQVFDTGEGGRLLIFQSAKIIEGIVKRANQIVAAR